MSALNIVKLNLFHLHGLTFECVAEFDIEQEYE